MWLRMLRLMFGLIPWLHSSCPVPKTRKVSRCPPQPQMVPSRTRVWYVFHLQFTGGCWRFLFFHGYRRQWVFVNHPFPFMRTGSGALHFPLFLVAVEFSLPRILLPLFLRWSNHVKGLSNPSDWCFFCFFCKLVIDHAANIFLPSAGRLETRCHGLCEQCSWGSILGWFGWSFVPSSTMFLGTYT